MNEFEYKVRYLDADGFLARSEQFVVKTEGDEEQARDEATNYADEAVDDADIFDYDIALIDAC